MPLIGDWDKLREVLARLADPKKLAIYIQDATEENGRLVVQAAKRGIERQRPEWPPLSPRTIEAWKRRLRRSGKKYQGKKKKLVVTHQLARSIDFRVRSPWAVEVGARRYAEESHANVALIHETGAKPAKQLQYDDLMALRVEWGTPDQRIPARPYMGPAIVETRQEIVRNWAEAVAKALKP